MTEYDDCPAVDAREAEEIEAECGMSVGEYEACLDELGEQGVIYVSPRTAERYAAMARFDNGQDGQ